MHRDRWQERAYFGDIQELKPERPAVDPGKAPALSEFPKQGLNFCWASENLAEVAQRNHAHHQLYAMRKGGPNPPPSFLGESKKEPTPKPALSARNYENRCKANIGLSALAKSCPEVEEPLEADPVEPAEDWSNPAWFSNAPPATHSTYQVLCDIGEKPGREEAREPLPGRRKGEYRAASGGNKWCSARFHQN
ncbi:hypothetical protein CYMTET_10399 [Cymbomonas tetramitiformis]|uniref:Uncharacterized protein n=1 Tax=Cymbomonas tetramitiformis TaxID=36881 RepID=A0AAE0GPK2_9CHLO|nr:hypothetical protein CYMTET_10399 [Cymbomonas tetramitiformis]